MIEFTNQIVVERPVDEVFGFVANFENVPTWNYYVLEVRQTSPGPVGVGATYHQVRKADAQDFRIMAFNANRQVAVETIPPSMPAFERRLTFEVAGAGTRIVDEWKLDTGRPALVERLGAGRIRSAVLENLGKLKVLLETGRVRLQDGRQVAL